MKAWLLAVGLLGGWASGAEARFLVARTSDDVVAFDLGNGEVVTRYGVPEEIRYSTQAIEWNGAGYLLSDADAARVWMVDARFHRPEPAYALPTSTTKGLTLHAGDLYVVSQSPVEPDSVFVIDGPSGAVERGFAVPDSIELQADIRSDGSHLWCVDAGARRLWRCEPTSGAFDLCYELPSQLTLAVAWDPDAGTLWTVDNSSRTAYTVDPSTGTLTPRFPIDPSVAVIWAAITTETVVPARVGTWASLKGRYGEAAGAR